MIDHGRQLEAKAFTKRGCGGYKDIAFAFKDGIDDLTLVRPSRCKMELQAIEFDTTFNAYLNLSLPKTRRKMKSISCFFFCLIMLELGACYMDRSAF